jgi:putative transposase
MSPNKLSHTVWECKYHLVWIPKYRRKVVFGRLRVEIGKILRRLCEYKGVEIIEANACRDHIHMCVSIPPKYAVASIVGYLKGKSAIEVFEKFSKLRRNFRGHHFWARGYYVSTVGLDEAKVRNYIKNQEDSDRQSDQGEAPHLDPFE